MTQKAHTLMTVYRQRITCTVLSGEGDIEHENVYELQTWSVAGGGGLCRPFRNMGISEVGRPIGREQFETRERAKPSCCSASLLSGVFLPPIQSLERL